MKDIEDRMIEVVEDHFKKTEEGTPMYIIRENLQDVKQNLISKKLVQMRKKTNPNGLDWEIKRHNIKQSMRGVVYITERTGYLYYPKGTLGKRSL